MRNCAYQKSMVLMLTLMISTGMLALLALKYICYIKMTVKLVVLDFLLRETKFRILRINLKNLLRFYIFTKYKFIEFLKFRASDLRLILLIYRLNMIS